MPGPTLDTKGPEKAEKQGSYRSLWQESPLGLWLIFLLKALFGLSTSALDAVLVLFLSDDFAMDDVSAGWAFGLTGFLTSLYGLACGFVIDLLGVRWSLLIGSSFLTVGLLLCAMANSQMIVLGSLFTCKAFGCAMFFAPLMFAIRRYTSAANRPFAFSLFYTVFNTVNFMAQLLLNAIRQLHPVRGMPESMSIWRIVVWAAAIFAVFCLMVCFFIKEPPESATQEEDGNAESALRWREDANMTVSQNIWDKTKKTMTEAKFWRLTALSFALVFTRVIFVYLAALFPKFWVRAMGANAPFELVVAVNPLSIMLLVPLCTSLVVAFQWKCATVIILGAFITAASPLPLAYWTAYITAIAFVFLLSLGEALWSPKFFEYSVAVSPVGREGTYGALSSLPTFSAALFAGGFSGHLLTEYCPSSQDCDGRSIWLLVSATNAIGAVVLLVFKSCLFVDKDWVEHDIRPVEGRYGATRRDE
eukprot:gnl/MRDRNA2_/MRDRNA2_76117_c0_seq1.p1 gnl/MRDRNA2_/MRDRNA2_76117_c0~~gnl/MRDRNA2_/MRDRNA2_76117_c0_seq1.p1  ORF type:complete len:475 (+),score=54.75 gnl/MRDRNA2_/MRDRNA2_76117_c0_seq1:131-1555(+)